MSTGPDPALTHRDRVQAAIGALVAHEEGRREDVRRMLAQVGTTADSAAALFTVAHLAVAAAAAESGTSSSTLLRGLSLDVARADHPGSR